jgi:hypothetical protein
MNSSVVLIDKVDNKNKPMSRKILKNKMAKKKEKTPQKEKLI